MLKINDWLISIDFETGMIYYDSLDREYCFIQRPDGIFLPYKKIIEKDYDYEYLEKKLLSLDECKRYMDEHRKNS